MHFGGRAGFAVGHSWLMKTLLKNVKIINNCTKLAIHALLIKCDHQGMFFRSSLLSNLETNPTVTPTNFFECDFSRKR